MIYLTFSEWAQDNHSVPPVLALNAPAGIGGINLQMRFYADSIFEFVNGTTAYYKDRLGSNYQYTEDEIIMFKLKNG
jgi:hypothetical protein